MRVDAALSQLEVEGASGAAPTGEAEAEAAPPAWETEAAARETMGAKKRWLHERGYGDATPKDHDGDARRALAAVQLGKLSDDADDAEAAQERRDEREALEAIFGDDLRPADAARPDDVCVVVAGHDPPAGAPPLVLDVLVANVAPAYPRAAPAVCVSGGGLSEAELRCAGAALAARCKAGEGPVVFDLVAAAADEAAAAQVKAEEAPRGCGGARGQQRAALLGSTSSTGAGRGVSSRGDAKAASARSPAGRAAAGGGSRPGRARPAGAVDDFDAWQHVGRL